MSKQTHHRHVDDTEVALAATLQRPDGTAVDLTDLTVRFKMVTEKGVSKVAETAATKGDDPTTGQCQYSFQAADVDTAGRFYGYFTTEDGSGNKDTFPVVQGDLEIRIWADG